MRLVRHVIAVAAAALLTVCAQPARGPEVGPTASSLPPPSPTNAARVLTFPLKSQTAKAHGDIVVTIGPTSYELSVAMRDLQPDARYLINLHNGSCALEDTSYLLNLGRFAADASGRAIYTQAFIGLFSVPATGRIVTLHGPLGTDDERVHIACGDMPR